MRAYRRCIFRVLNEDSFTLESMQAQQSQPSPEGVPPETSTQTTDAAEEDIGGKPEGRDDDEQAVYPMDNEPGAEEGEEAESSEVDSEASEVDQFAMHEAVTDQDESSPNDDLIVKANQEEVGELIWTQSYDDDEEADLWTAWHRNLRAVVSVGQVVYLSIYDGCSEKELFGTRFESRQQAQLVALDKMIGLLP